MAKNKIEIGSLVIVSLNYAAPCDGVYKVIAWSADKEYSCIKVLNENNHNIFADAGDYPFHSKTGRYHPYVSEQELQTVEDFIAQQQQYLSDLKAQSKVVADGVCSVFRSQRMSVIEETITDKPSKKMKI